MEFLDKIKSLIPDYAKDVRLNVDSVIARSTLSTDEAIGSALAAAFTVKSKTLVKVFKESGLLDELHTQAVLTAASLIGMTNAWYSYTGMAEDDSLKNIPAQLRMTAYSSHGGVEKRKFEIWALASSIVGKCKFCIAAHVDVLKKDGVTAENLRDIGRIAAVINSVSQILAAEGHE